LGAPSTARAAAVYEAMLASGVGLTELSARLHIARSTLRRWLDGDSRATAAFSLDALCAALGATSDRRQRLMTQLASSMPASHLMPAADHDRVPDMPAGARETLAALLRDEMRVRGLSKRKLAERLGVAPTTVTRLLNGEVTRSRLSIEAVCDAIGFSEDSMRRRELLRLAAAGALALSVGAPAVLRSRSLDLDEIGACITAVERLRAQGYPREAWTMSQAPELRGLIRRARALERDPQAWTASYRYDFMLATLQEQLLPWKGRRAMAIAWYERARDALLARAPANAVSHEMAQIYERTAPLYRELGDFNESVWQYDYALRQRMERAEDIALAVHLWRNRAHVWAVQGDERRWRSDLDAARGMIARLPADMRDELYGLITYSEGEGCKRLAGQLDLTPRARRSLAAQAHSTLLRSLTQTREQWAAHTVVTQLSVAQALVWLDAAAARAMTEDLGPLITARFPAHVSKLEETRLAAERALGLHRLQPLQV
jgi:transcriptional regulator with XRE-family HTH domain